MLQTGIKGERTLTVTEALSAKTIGSGELDVFATPAVLALVEETAWRSIAEELASGQGSVGTFVSLSHIAATPLGKKVRCETTLTEIDRRKLTFSFAVFDGKEKIAEGTHERFLVENEQFQKKADAK